MGREAVLAAFVFLIFSVDTDFKISMLPHIANAYNRGELLAWDFAYLFDICCLEKNQPQKYGTLVKREGQNLVAHPIEDPINLDDRRKAMGLLPMREYIEGFIDHQGLPVMAWHTFAVLYGLINQEDSLSKQRGE